MPTKTIAEAIMTTVASYGVDTVFGIPGTHNVELYRPLKPLGFRAVTTRHEQGAGYAADAWSQRTGLPGTVITTSGPGLLNALSAAATAYCESRPMLILSPGAPTGSQNSDVGALHETRNPTGAVGALIVESHRAVSAADAVDQIHAAFELFATRRPRPFHLEIPLDILDSSEMFDDGVLAARKFTPPRAAAPGDIAAAVDALASATSPMIIAGGGATSAAAEVRSLAERLQAPVVTSVNGKGVLPEDHPLSLGASLRFGPVLEWCNEADVLLVVGSKVGESELWGGTIERTGPTIRIDIDPGQLDMNLTSDIHLHGDSTWALGELLAGLEKTGPGLERSPADLTDQKRTVHECALAESPASADIVQAIAQALPPETLIAGDSSQVTYLATVNLIPTIEPGQLLYMPAYATLGYGLPAAIGGKVASSDRPVCCIVGDGALMFSLQEMMTAVEQQLAITLICVDNGGYGEIRTNMLQADIEPVGVDLAQPDWVKLAESFGFTATSVTSTADLPDVVGRHIAMTGPNFIHVKTGN